MTNALPAQAAPKTLAEVRAILAAHCDDAAAFSANRKTVYVVTYALEIT